MAFFSNIVFNKDTCRHEIEFINQQFDFLMGICYYEESKGYGLNVDVTEAKLICKKWSGGEFDMDYWMKIAVTEFPERDKIPLAKE